MRRGDRKRVLLLGDSITQQSFSLEHGGWGAGLADWYSRRADVVNRGFSGYNSRWVLDILSELLSSLEPASVLMCTIFFGANDAVMPEGTQHVPLEEFVLNLSAMVAMLRAHAPQCVVVLIAPPTVDSAQWPTRSPAQAATYAAAVAQVAQAERARGSPVALLELSSLTPEDLHDGLHLGRSGNAKLLSLLKALVKEQYAQLCPEEEGAEGPALPLHFPPCKSFSEGSSVAALESIRSWHW